MCGRPKADWATAWWPSPAEEAAHDVWKQGTRVGAVMRSTAARWGLAGGKVLPTSTGGAPRWHQAGGVEAGLTLAAARCEGSERWRRRRGDSQRRGRAGSGERRGGPVARGGGEGGGCGMMSDRRGGNDGVGGVNFDRRWRGALFKGGWRWEETEGGLGVVADAWRKWHE
jgi:hypothetical protein